MAHSDDVLRFQSEHHPMEGTNRFETLEQYCLYLMHLRAYEEVCALAQGKSVLDLGCNNGWGTNVVARTAGRVVGVDVSDSALEEARRGATSDNIEFLRVDGEKLPFADGEFDVVASCQVIEHVADYGPYLGEICRVLGPRGVAVFSTPNARIRLDPGMKPWFPFHVREFSGAQLEELLREWFPRVQVRGLFATENLYQIEFGRVQRAREQARRRAKAWLPPYQDMKAKVFDVAKAILPQSVVQGLRAVVRATSSESPSIAAEQAPTKAELPQWAEQFSTSDLHYSEQDIDQALDLLAVCRKDAAG
jgi:ubiquinone/menaquinone biosynthesis C-methylase UbiE